MGFTGNAIIYKVIFYLTCGLVIIGIWGATATATSEIILHAIRFGIRPDGVRLVLDSSDSLNIEPFLEEELLILPLPPVAWNSDVPKPPAKSCIIQCDLTTQDGGQQRLACETTPTSRLKTFFKMPPDQKYAHHRFVVDIKSDGKTAEKPAASETETPAAETTEPGTEELSFEAQIQAAIQEAEASKATPEAPAPEPAQMPAEEEPVEAAIKELIAEETPPTAEKTTDILPPQKPSWAFEVTVIEVPGEKRIVVIDPGHGGADPGTIGVSGTREKNITLEAAKTIQRILEETGRYTVVLTREGDQFLKLRERINRARNAGGHLFISIHADAHKNPETRGMSFYTLSKVASDEEAEKLAQKENKADLILGLDLSAEPEDVANILIDLVQRENMNLSAQLAESLRLAAHKHIKLLRNAHRFADFGVLKAPDMPAVLIELGYLSNQEDEQLLQNPAHQERIGQTLAQGIDAYLAKI